MANKGYHFNAPPLLTPKEEKSLALQIKRGGKKGKAARNKFIESNMRLVITVAKPYMNKGVDPEDLINEGNIGLAIAVDKYNPSKGAKFSTYAIWWIKQKILRYLTERGRTIRVPSHIYQSRAKILKYVNDYEEDKGVFPSAEQISKKFDLKRCSVRHILESGQAISSLDVEFSNDIDSEFSLSSVIPDEKSPDPFLGASLNSDKKNIEIFLSRLTKRESSILKLRFGLETGEPMTLERVGEAHDITRERVRQIEVVAKRKLRRLMSKFKEDRI